MAMKKERLKDLPFYEYFSLLHNLVLKNNGEIPLILGNTDISWNIREVFPLIAIQFFDFGQYLEVNRNFSAYLSFMKPCFTH
ncbi:hypothetical protein WQ57_01265 [Mesobacillus campisalis]|uniref:Uncharacterized protein n=1 Tax=Mesobacillus campisalis TaxID=1408103 RepID=A0A0M2T537_9BACI|nr:hypothetical protein WQ57_01265 [Mesobacillus campisalis]